MVISKKIIPIIAVIAIVISLVALQNDSGSIKTEQGIPNQPIAESITQGPPEIKTAKESTILKAAIIDQLHDDIPNENFQANATAYLTEAGYSVDLFTTGDITVDFYRNLPLQNYQYVVFRTHGLEQPNSNSTWLFTGEKYDQTKYRDEQLSDYLSTGIPFIAGINQTDISTDAEKREIAYENRYFTFGSKLVKEQMKGMFPDSVLLIGGCDSLRNHDLAEALMIRGAKHVIGWDASITSTDNDRIMLEFLEETLINKNGINESVVKLNDKHLETMDIPSQLVAGTRR